MCCFSQTVTACWERNQNLIQKLHKKLTFLTVRDFGLFLQRILKFHNSFRDTILMHKKNDERSFWTECWDKTFFSQWFYQNKQTDINHKSKNQHMKAADEPRCIKTPLNVNITDHWFHYWQRFAHRTLKQGNILNSFSLFSQAPFWTKHTVKNHSLIYRWVSVIKVMYQKQALKFCPAVIRYMFCLFDGFVLDDTHAAVWPITF